VSHEQSPATVSGEADAVQCLGFGVVGAEKVSIHLPSVANAFPHVKSALGLSFFG